MGNVYAGGTVVGKAFFISGTGTDVGKSVVCAALLKNLPHAQAIKIIQTGGELYDQLLYAAACPNGNSKTLRCFALPASPHMAAKAEGQSISISGLAHEIKKEVQGGHLTLLEGSGGVMTPLSANETFLDLMLALDYPVILVVNNVLGAINHALLSINALKRAGLTPLGIIITHPDSRYTETNPVAIDNIRSIEEHGQIPILGTLPHLPELTPELEEGAKQTNTTEKLEWEDASGPKSMCGTKCGTKCGARCAAWNTSRSEAWSEAWNTGAACLEKAARNLLISDKEATTKAASTLEDAADFDHKHLWHPYCPAPGKSRQNWLVEKAAGNYIFLKNGKPLLDGMSSWWCAIHGYGQPELIAAIKQQAQKLPHVMFGGLTHEPATMLGQSLLPLLPCGLNHLFLADSGSVAVEVALKMSVQYWQGRGHFQKNRFISHYGAYHGDTLGAMSVSDPINGMHSRFKGFFPKQIFVPRPANSFHAAFHKSSLNALAKTVEKHHQECAAVIIEPIVQGAGGMWMYHPGYLKGLKEICRQYDLLLIYDEIATGFGRTGKMFAAEWAGVSPDILCLGKALTGGTMTLAATTCTDDVAQGISKNDQPLMHGPTFMGNPLACRVAQANIALLQSSAWKEQVSSIKRNLEQGLTDCRELPEVKDVRILGAIGAVEMQQPVNTDRLCRYFVEKHDVWVRPFSNLIYVMPPYTVTKDECLRLTTAIKEAIKGRQWA